MRATHEVFLVVCLAAQCTAALLVLELTWLAAPLAQDLVQLDHTLVTRKIFGIVLCGRGRASAVGSQSPLEFVLLFAFARRAGSASFIVPATAFATLADPALIENGLRARRRP